MSDLGVPPRKASGRVLPSKSSAGLPASGLFRSIAHAPIEFYHRDLRVIRGVTTQENAKEEQEDLPHSMVMDSHFDIR
jgi:hypothetical protein